MRESASNKHESKASERTHNGVAEGSGIKIERSITIRRPIAELYAFWRDFENLPRIMSHLTSVKVLDDKTSLWTAKTVGGVKFEWQAEIINEKENELIGWESVWGSEVANAGSVRFYQTNKGTEIRVNLKYDPPGGKIGVAIAKLFLKDPGTEIADDLAHFKQFMETGEVASVYGQSSARTSDFYARRTV